MAYKYRETVLEELSRHGIRPDNNTPPELVHDFLNDLYRYEIRLLKSRLNEGLIARSDYAAHVTHLRKQYPLLSLPLRFWAEE